ncbi:hypothetical protein [Vibrio splendidus]|uniref:hypothetical protein n=1 Tax=Vibrio splendidus TaxID=29497 RepID=UPI000C83F394|nr:hypothetical protein [Vibrio splendidus]PMK16052.1 hypothetical protein BCU08_00800 [Vibrio splendidus]
MVNQNIEQLLQQAVDQSMAQTQESRELAEEVSGKMGYIDQKVVEAEQRTDVAIANVNAAIPDALNTGLNLRLYIDGANGDDTTADGTQGKPFKTLKALLDWAPVGSNIRIDCTSQVIDIDEKITLIKKDVTFTSQNCVLNFNAHIEMYNSKFKTSYSNNTINQNVEAAFTMFSSSLNVICTVNPGAGSLGLAKNHGAYYGYITSPLSDIYFGGEITDAEAEYSIVAHRFTSCAFIAVFGNVTLGTKCVLFNASMSSVQVGARQVYLLGI